MKITKQVRISINVNDKYCWYCRFYQRLEDIYYDSRDSETCCLFDESVDKGRCKQCIKLFGGAK
jgi:hypothetical protein